ncbi:MAG: 16S rRNA (cytidine(1402)-2'-O)-methyltransferase [Mollicutes bacterium]|nr:16S rRNA (cytidine(1402)-2'-O)-methyltransferase [Mollicutes bacterium]MDD7264594.1 16S rRNA (cytidine(1402)-2'-O)-methyltransferase [bacterium]MDY4979858.1 16S rRNA (cytidine(1402)-2'-O)-methyltransferase [Candidatus Onthovivens sp.]
MQRNNIGTLYLVPTPIGNLKDVTSRALEIYNLVDYIACEDTRNTSKLLHLLGIDKPTFSCHEHNELTASNKIISDLLDGKNIAYSSDAGMPCISDPGYLLLNKCIENNINIIPLPGANAALTALIASGLETKHFLFYGFLDPKISQKERELEDLINFPYTIIFYESPHKIYDTLKSLYKIFGNRKITICRELTKLHEEFIRTNLLEASKIEDNLIGEMVLIVEGNNKEKSSSIDDESISELYNKLINNGLSNKDAVIALSALFDIKKNALKKLTMK